MGMSFFHSAPERNSVVPTMSDGSSIDFSVTSGNLDLWNLEYYVKRKIQNQNNSSESDHLDKVVAPPSLAMPNVPVGSNPNSNGKPKHNNNNMNSYN